MKIKSGNKNFSAYFILDYGWNNHAPAMLVLRSMG